MNKERTFRANTLSTLHLLLPFLIKFALILTILDWRSPWFVVLMVVIGLTITAKQIVPHHFILWTLPLALASHPTVLFFVAWVILWLIQDFSIWKNPKLIYPLTFRFRNNQVKDYGQLLDDADQVIAWVKANTKEGEAIFVNGFENNLYLECNRPASNMLICEAVGHEEIELPRVYLHSAGTATLEFDLSNYRHVLISPMGLYTIMVKKDA